MKVWHKAIIVIASMLMIAFPLSKYAMSLDKQSNTSEYRLKHVPTEKSKLKLGTEVLGEMDQETLLVATVKVTQEGYVPSGVEIRTWISPTIFTANIRREMLDHLEDDPGVVSIEPAYKLRLN